MARAKSTKQSLALAYGRYLNGVTRRDERPALTEYQQRLAAESRGNRICWKCDKERSNTPEACAHCGAESTPF